MHGDDIFEIEDTRIGGAIIVALYLQRHTEMGGMDFYFQGSKLVKEFKHEVDRKNYLTGKISASWIDTGIGQASHCGADSELTVEDTYGVTDAEVNRFEEEVGFQFGIPNVMQVKNGIKEGSDHTLTLNRQVKTSRKFPISSDKCGSTCVKIFKKVFTVDIVFFRNGLFGRVHEARSQFREETQYVDCQIYKVEDNKDCGCTDKELKPTDGNIRMSWGFLSILTPFFNTKIGFVAEVGGLEFELPAMALSGGASAAVDPKVIPDLYRFLSRDTSQVFNIRLELDSLASFPGDQPIAAPRVGDVEALAAERMLQAEASASHQTTSALKSH